MLGSPVNEATIMKTTGTISKFEQAREDAHSLEQEKRNFSLEPKTDSDIQRVKGK